MSPYLSFHQSPGDPEILMIGASGAFINPAGLQTNLMVQGHGGYTFGDFAKVGLPLTEGSMRSRIRAGSVVEISVTRSGGSVGGRMANGSLERLAGFLPKQQRGRLPNPCAMP